jgi:hypothetical protein
MNESDLELYLRARDKLSLGNVVYLIAVAITALAILTVYIPGFEQFTKYLFMASIFVGTLTFGVRSRIYVSRADLLDILERQVNNDPEALRRVAQFSNKKSGQNA